MDNRESHYLRELIRALVRNLGILEKDEAACCGITISQCHAIVEVGRAEEISLNELAKTLQLDKSTMSRTINNLVGSGLVIRELHPEDRRYLTIKLTDKGRELYKNTEGSMENYYRDIFRSVPENKREQLLVSLKALTDAVKQNKKGNC